MSEFRYWLWLASRRIDRKETVDRLLAGFETPSQIFYARREDYKKLGFLSAAEMASLEDKNIGKIARAIQVCNENGWQILLERDTGYPERLRNIHTPPMALYMRGRRIDIDSEVVITVVGTRRCTPYGLKVAERIGYELAQSGCVVATGLARGIDSAAARGALRGGGRVIGVVASGLDIVYPPENVRLFDDVAAEGMILTEYMPGVGVTRGAFPRRNRIMSGIGLGTVVIEAPEGSGALITANWALEQGRDVFAVPGNIDAEACKGSNKLLREGAEIVLCGWDIAEAYQARFPDKIHRADPKKAVALDSQSLNRLVERELSPQVSPPAEAKKTIDKSQIKEYIDVVQSKGNLTEAERQVLSAMDAVEMQVDDVIAKSGLPAAKVLSALTMLEINGVISQQQGKRFVLKLDS